MPNKQNTTLNLSGLFLVLEGAASNQSVNSVSLTDQSINDNGGYGAVGDDDDDDVVVFDDDDEEEE